LREIAIHEFMKRIAEAVSQEFSKVPDLRAVMIGGPGPTKDEFIKSDLLPGEISKKVAAVLDTGYTDEQGIKELVNKSGEVLAELDVMKEKALMQRFLSGLVERRELVAHGESTIRRCLEQGAVELLLVSEALRSFRVTTRCQSCGHELRETVGNVEVYKNQLAERACLKCGMAKLVFVEGRDVVGELCELADKYGTGVEFISSETEEGQQLLAAFKGLAAILRFQPA
jgi:peptide chain release factor subunit 1